MYKVLGLEVWRGRNILEWSNVFGHLMWRAESWEKTLMLEKIEGRRRRGWHHHLDGHEFEQAPGAGDGQGSLACCSPWGHKESDMTEWLNWTERLLVLTGEPEILKLQSLEQGPETSITSKISCNTGAASWGSHTWGTNPLGQGSANYTQGPNLVCPLFFFFFSFSVFI